MSLESSEKNTAYDKLTPQRKQLVDKVMENFEKGNLFWSQGWVSSGQYRDDKPNAYYMKLASESMKTIREMRGSIAAAQENSGFTKGKIGINSKR